MQDLSTAKKTFLADSNVLTRAIDLPKRGPMLLPFSGMDLGQKWPEQKMKWDCVSIKLSSAEVKKGAQQCKAFSYLLNASTKPYQSIEYGKIILHLQLASQEATLSIQKRLNWNDTERMFYESFLKSQ